MTETELLPTLTEEAPEIVPLRGKVKNRARDMYFQGFYVTDIVETLNIDINELGLAVFGHDGTGSHPGCWSYQRMHRPVSSVTSYAPVKSLLLKKAEAKLVHRVIRSLDAIEQIEEAEGPMIMDSEAMNKTINMIEKLDRITRLEEGKATQHIAQERRTYSLREIAEQQNGGQIEDTEQHTISIDPTDYAEVSEVDRPNFRIRDRDSSEGSCDDEERSPRVFTDSDGTGWHPRDSRTEEPSNDNGVPTEPMEREGVQE